MTILIFLVACILCGVFLRATDDDSDAERFWGVGFLTTLFVAVILSVVWIFVSIASAFY